MIFGIIIDFGTCIRHTKVKHLAQHTFIFIHYFRINYFSKITLNHIYCQTATSFPESGFNRNLLCYLVHRQDVPQVDGEQHPEQETRHCIVSKACKGGGVVLRGTFPKGVKEWVQTKDSTAVESYGLTWNFSFHPLYTMFQRKE